LIQTIIHAMGQLEIEAVATSGPNLDVNTLQAPGNVHLLRSAPHDTVMQEVSLVISQGGHGTVNRALVNGVPLLILPMGRDQGDNAARVDSKGAGLQLPPTASETPMSQRPSRAWWRRPCARRSCGSGSGEPDAAPCRRPIAPEM